MALTAEQFQKLLEQNHQQQQSIIAALTKQKSGNMTKCKCFFNGEKETEKVESFLSAIHLFRNLERISDEDFIQGLPLVLHKDAGTWWRGVKEEITTVADFESRLREKFSPLKLPHLLYQELLTISQSASETTENFITNKRMLFSLLPEPKHPEPQQLDMIYHLLRLDIRDKAPRASFTTYNQLLESAGGIEQINKEKKASHPTAPSLPRNTKIRCSFCKNPGHAVAECRKKKIIESRDEHRHTSKDQVKTQASSPTEPKFSCYGCGAPNVVRTNCPTCSHQKSSKLIKEEIGFCSLSIRHETRPRPVIPATIGGVKGYPYFDTCAKTNVASYSLYCRLLEQGYGFKEEKVELTLADGDAKSCTVLTVRVDVEVFGRVFPTSFMVLPESKKNKTLLGIGFLTRAMMVLNLPQFTWHFIDNPDEVHELFTEDFVRFNDEGVSQKNAQRQTIMPHKTNAPVHAMSTTPSISSGADSLVFILEPRDDASLPDNSAQMKRKYELTEITFGTPKHVKTLFDGYSPRLNYMYRDAQMSVQRQEVELSPHSLALFPDTSEIGINTVDIELPSNDELTTDRQNQLRSLFSSYEDVFTPNGEPAKHVQHIINTAGKGPISVPPYRLSPPRRDILRKEIDKMTQDGVIEPRITAAPVVLVPKKNGEIRVCIDYRRLNSITVPDSSPIPRIDDLLHEAKPTSFMSSLDLKAGYWQVEVNKDDIDKTRFITPFGIYVFKRM